MPQRDRRDLARRLLRRADDDATLVPRVVDDTDIADAIIGFHAQEAAILLPDPTDAPSVVRDGVSG